MNNDSPSDTFSCDRRSFLRLSAGAAAGMFLMQLPKLTLAAPPTLASTALKDCPTDPLIAAQRSDCVQKAYRKVLDFAKQIHSPYLRRKTLDILKHPSPTFMEQYTLPGSVAVVYRKLAQQQLIDPQKVRPETLFPPCKKPSAAPQPFSTAPGSSYGSHHAYPGGLATHTAANLGIADAICNVYKEAFAYQVDRDTVLAAEALHDLAKPWVFQWRADGSSMPELPIAGTGAHHVLSLAEVIYRGLPVDTVVAQACAHSHPGAPKEEADVVSWIKAAAILAGKDPVRLGLLRGDGKGLPAPHKQEGYIVHLGDHDFVLSVPAAQQAVAALRRLAQDEYGMDKHALESLPFNAFRNYVGAQLGFLRLHCVLANEHSGASFKQLIASIISK